MQKEISNDDSLPAYVKKLIVTADDFGLNVSVNQAIEKAHREGILTSTSLMVGEPAVHDAVERAHNLPGLRVGLHLCVVDGLSVLPHSDIPHIVNHDGCFSPNMIRVSLRVALSPKIQYELEKEIRAQFEAYHETGLLLDHVDVHHHLHLHPFILKMILHIGKSYGMKAMRLVHEPMRFSRKIRGTGLISGIMVGGFLRPWSGWMRRQLVAHGMKHNDRLFGMFDAENIDEPMMLRLLDHLPGGITEVHFHPRHEDDIETRALTSPRVRQRIEKRKIHCCGYDDIIDY